MPRSISSSTESSTRRNWGVSVFPVSATGAYAVTFSDTGALTRFSLPLSFHATLMDMESLPTGMGMRNCCASADTASTVA